MSKKAAIVKAPQSPQAARGGGGHQPQATSTAAVTNPPISSSSTASSAAPKVDTETMSESSSTATSSTMNATASSSSGNSNNYLRSLSLSAAPSDPGMAGVKVIPLSTRRGFSIESLGRHGSHDVCSDDDRFGFPSSMSIVTKGSGGGDKGGKSEEYKHEHRKISTSNIRKIVKDGVIQETHETTNQQVEKLQAGDLQYHEARHSKQVRDKVEGEGYSAERIAGKRQDRKILTCGEQTDERNMDSNAMASRVVTAAGSVDEIAMAKQEERRHFNKGLLEGQYADRQMAASRSVANAATGVVSKVSVSHRMQPTEEEMSGSPFVTSPNGNSMALQTDYCHSLAAMMEENVPCLSQNNRYFDVALQVQEEFRQLSEQSPSDQNLPSVIKGFREKLRSLIDQLKKATSKENKLEILQAMVAIAKSAWAVPAYCHNLGSEMCTVLREESGLGHLIELCRPPAKAQETGEQRSLQERLTFEAASLIEQALSPENRAYIVEHGLDAIKNVAVRYAASTPTARKTRVGTGIICRLFKHSEATCSHLLADKALDFILTNCRSTDVQTLRNCAAALANLALYGGADIQKIMVDSRRAVPIWLFPLAFHHDDFVTYWACLAVSVLAANHEIEGVVRQSGTLDLVEPFLSTRDPERFARSNQAHFHGQSEDWLQRFVPVLSSRVKQACSLAAFHFAMEAIIKRQQNNTGVFSRIRAVESLKRAASSPNDIASKFAARALRIIGEKLPQALSQQVPLWKEHDVQQWVRQIGFPQSAPEFLDAKVDGDLLLQIDESMLEKDIGISKQLLRKRFLRELRKLKQMADYSSVDPSNIAQVLSNIDPDFTQYTYGFLRSGVDVSLLSRLTEDQLKDECGIENSVHRKKILSYLSVIYPSLSEVDSAEDSKKSIDVFISYRRSTGSQLASLLKVHLQLKGFTVFIDVERLEAGKFDNNLLNSIRQARSFILVLTAGALDRCQNDVDRRDWVHKEIVEAIDADCNIIPITDNFVWPDVNDLPEDIRPILYYNAINWIHDYQDACVDKIERFIRRDRQATEKAGTATPDSPSGRGWGGYGHRSASVELDRLPVSPQETRETQTGSSEENGDAEADYRAGNADQQPTVEMPQSPTPVNF